MQANNSNDNSPIGYQRKDSHDFVPFDVETPQKYAFKFILLNPGITPLNFACCLLHYMLMIFSVVSSGVLQPLILLDENYFNIDQKHAGTTTSMLLIVQLVVKIAVSIPYGHYSDKIGRKVMIFYGATNFFISCLLVPLQTTVFPGFVLTKLLLSNGATAISTIPLLADYVADETKGKAAGLLAMCISLSAILANVFLKILFYKEVSIGGCYVWVGAVGFCGLLLNTLGLKGGRYYTQKTATIDIDRSSLKQTLIDVLQIFYLNGWLMITMVIHLLGSSDFMVFFTFMTLYIKSLFPADTPTASTNIVVNNIQTLVLLPSFFGNLFYGYFLDKGNKAIQVILFALGGGACSFILISATETPYDWSIKLGSLIMGATLPGLFVISSYLGIKNYPAEKRGIMIGFAQMVGYIGYFIIATGGGYLYDNWRKDGPFIVCCGLLGVAVILVLKINKLYALSK